MSFVIGSIWAQKNTTNMRIDHSSIQQLPEKPNLNRTYEWYEYADILEATNLNWPTPERATFFEIWDFCISGPVTIEQLSHVFYEHPDYPWPDSTFHFKIYDADGTTLLHESGDLEAAHYVEQKLRAEINKEAKHLTHARWELANFEQFVKKFKD